MQQISHVAHCYLTPKPGGYRLFRVKCGRRLNKILTFVLISLTCNTFVWATHVDEPVDEVNSQVEANIHQHQESGSKQIVNYCDHCCHASAHLLALKSSAVVNIEHLSGKTFQISAFAPIEVPLTPPFIPPIA